MTDLAETALAFAKECMGWSDAEAPRHASRRKIEIQSYAGDGKFITKRFNFTDLNVVEKAVRKWCQLNGAWFKLFLNVDHSLTVTVEPIRCDAGLGSSTSSIACQALMQACLEAARKLKGTA